MLAIRQHEFGPPENLLYEELPDLVPGEGQARIAVESSGVHLIDTAIRRGLRSGPFPVPDLPMTPGREVAGTIDAVGPGVDPAWTGRRAVAHLGGANGGYATAAVTAVDGVHLIPDQLDAAVAVAMIGTGRTALGILDVAALTKQDVVLVTAAAGGLGTLFVQAAQRVGAIVVGAAGGPDKTERTRALGAIAVDYDRSGWSDQVRESLGGQDVSVVLDGVGGTRGRSALELLGVAGRLVLYGNASGELTPLTTEDLAAKGLTATWAIGPRLLQRPGGLRELETRALEEAATGRLTPQIQTFPLAEAAVAHRALESRATVGKVVLVP
ncbi:MAG: zinc-binding dehydrogenase [Acidimicrobiales bacterium]